MSRSVSGTFQWTSESAREVFWETIRETFGPGLSRYVAKSGCSADEIEEIVTDVFGELAMRETAFIASGMHWDFVLPILRDCCARAQQRWRQEFPAISDAFESPDPGFAEAFEARCRTRRAWIDTILAQLPQQQRMVVQLRYLDRLSYSDIALLVNTTEGSARASVSFGLTRMRLIAESSPPAADDF